MLAVKAVKTAPCPTCGKHSPFTPENPFRPFCSERCKLIDLGQWATESYRIPGTTVPLDDEQAST